MTKYIVTGVIALIIAGGVFGGYKYLVTPVQQVAGSPVGTTFNTSKFAGVNVNLANPGANGTSTTILNSDASDRYITSIETGCEGVGTSKTAYTGVGLSALTLSVATTSTANIATNGNANVVGGGTITMGTSTSQFAISTSTNAGANGNPAPYFIWGAGTYLDFTFNATNTAACTVGVKYIAS